MTQLYDKIGERYRDYRRPDPRIAAAIMAALGGAQTILNVGAGAGSYEPVDREVVAIEPSQTMIGQRPRGSAPVVRGSAMQLPFADGQFDAAMAVLTVHHWPDQARGLREMSRIAKRSVILTWDNAQAGMWLIRDYFPQIKEKAEAICLPASAYRQLFKHVELVAVPVPHDCTDGFLHAYWRRPEAYFDPGARRAISAFAGVEGVEIGLAALRRDLDDGTWLRRNRHLLGLTELDLGYRLVVAGLP